MLFGDKLEIKVASKSSDNTFKKYYFGNTSVNRIFSIDISLP